MWQRQVAELGAQPGQKCCCCEQVPFASVFLPSVGMPKVMKQRGMRRAKQARMVCQRIMTIEACTPAALVDGRSPREVSLVPWSVLRLQHRRRWEGTRRGTSSRLATRTNPDSSHAHRPPPRSSRLLLLSVTGSYLLLRDLVQACGASSL